MIRTIEFCSAAERDFRMNHYDFYPKTVDCSLSIATNRMVSIPNDRFEYRQSKGSRMFPFPSAPVWPISSRLRLRYCYVIRRVVEDLTAGVSAVSWLFWIRGGNILNVCCGTDDFLLHFLKVVITASIFRASFTTVKPPETRCMT